ncbi:MAG: caspase family protein [Kiritimatiellia bacterium]|jgi:uncharacterized caspase-like protein|nr:caspase family protein [Kiritimatiellia bacterium]
MSTPDNESVPRPAAPAAGGVNAWKRNPAGLTPVSVAEGRAPDTHPPPQPEEAVAAAPGSPSSRKPVRILALSAAVLAGLLLGARVLVRLPPPSGRAPAVPRSASAAPEARPRAGTADAVGLPAYRALVIGINRYAACGGEGWQVLQSARADAEAVARVLADDYGFQVRTLLDGEATRATILNALDELATTGRDGADLIYFAGHGYYDGKLREGYWIPADARKTLGGREAKEDWLWNSTLTRLIGASRARHVLVLSDACYSGALFRGDAPLASRASQAWYERAIAKPSRYLITSGGLEPVLDSGAGHSVFAQQVLHYFRYGDKEIFSANDLGAALRERVAELTGQMVQMGPLPVSGHAGGEFVFIRQRRDGGRPAFTPRAEPESAEERMTRGAEEAPGADARQETLRDALALTRAGAPKAAGQLVAGVVERNAQDPLARSVAAYIARSQNREARDEVGKLIALIASRKKTSAGTEAEAAQRPQPRVLACLGPSVSPEAADREGAALLYRIALGAELESRIGLRIIEREALAAILQEQQLGSSDLADPRARTAIGRLLPASVLLLGDLLPSGKGETLYLRLIDTETTQVLGSFTATRNAEQDTQSVCSNLAAQIAGRLVAAKPLAAPVTRLEGSRLEAALGTFHGVRKGSRFRVALRIPRDGGSPGDRTESRIGEAVAREVSDFACEAEAVWRDSAPKDARHLWLIESDARTAVAP